METENEFKMLTISSKAFRESEDIPKKYTCEGENINPPIDIAEITEKVKSLALIVDDPDAPRGTWLHWCVWNIPVTGHINENSAPGNQGMNDFEKCSYSGPCPPSGTHRYFFRVYGLDNLLDLKEGATRHELAKAMRGHICAYGELVGLYKKSEKFAFA